MENYKLLQKLGKGAQGSVYLVECYEDHNTYVLKKIECNDEHEANKAFKEAMALQELRHEFICGYKEFFVTWDKEEEAMFVCIVMDYYEMGDLAKVIKTKRAKKEKIEKMILKKWLGQMLEALVFVHKKRVIHRDLKPSNIFMTTNLNITIGDFGVSTVMGDARTRTRTTVGSMNWMAPEVMERPYDERSDVWSFGCIILELATCGFLDSQEISSILFEIKQNPQCLEDNLSLLVNEGYSPRLSQLIRDMLRRNFQQRPTAIDLLSYPYVKECLMLNPSSQLVEKKKQTNKPIDPMPKSKSPGDLFSYMQKHVTNAEAQIAPFKHLAAETQKNKIYCSKIDTKMRRLICEIMKKNTDCLELQLNGCKILLNLIEKSPEQSKILFEKESISAVISAMKSDSTHRDLQLVSSSLIMILSAEEDAAEKIGELGGVQDILSLLRQFKKDAEICLKCCSALWSLCVNEYNAGIVTEEKGVQDICNVIEIHSKSPDVLETACSAIWSLSLDERNLNILCDVAISQISDVLKHHFKHSKVVKSSLMALATIVAIEEECAYNVLACDAGLKVIINCYKHHRLETEIVDSFVTLLVELTEYDNIVPELKSFEDKLKPVALEILSKYRSNPEIEPNIKQVVEKIKFK